MTKMPPLLLPPPHHQPTNILLFQSYPPYYYYYHFYPPNPNPVYFYPGQLLLPPPPTPIPTTVPYLTPETTPTSSAVGPTTPGPRARKLDHPRWPKTGQPPKVWKPKPIINNNGEMNNNNNNNKKKKKKKKMENPKVEDEVAKSSTIMLRNIPNSLSRNNLMELLDGHCRKQNGTKDGIDNRSFVTQYDFLYLPFDFLRGQNLGYAFINFTTMKGASSLYTCWNNKGWEGCPKIRAITPAKLQGLAQCRRHFESSVFICESKGFLPVEFSPPRNGFNGDVCKATTIGKWIYNGECPRKRSSNNNWWVKTIHPPRLKPNSSKR
ncbi:hypothetical protein vseg_004614 [Gypsophila vaccaria]